MKENWYIALKFALDHEGIHSNDPVDPGGDTKYGIARKFHPDLTPAQWGDFTLADAEKIYKRDYWDACNCDSLAYPLDIVVFDTAVNCGCKKAKELRSKCINFKHYIQLRKAYYEELVNQKPKLGKFLHGWLNRCDDLIKQYNPNKEEMT